MKRLLAVCILALGAGFAAPAQTVIRMGTLAPKGSRWHQILLDMGEKWKQISGGKIQLKVYPGGEQGDEPEMVQKLRIKELQAVALSGAGLTGIDSGVAALQIPLMLQSNEELDYVRDKIAPQLEKNIAARGFIVLNWADAGWIHFFTKKPAITPDDFRKLKLCVLQGDSTTFELYKANGFRPVSLAATDILTGLQTGLIDGFQAPPLVALSSQWFGAAHNMLDIPFAPLVGATLISKDVWNRIPEAQRKPMMEASRQAGVELRQEIRTLDASSVGLMETFGLNVEHADPAAVAAWTKLIDGLYPKLRGAWVSARLFDEVRQLRDQYRKEHAAPQTPPRVRTKRAPSRS